VRELHHAIERLVVTVDSLVIDVTHLPKRMFEIIDTSELPEIYPHKNESFEERMKKYESLLVQDAFQKYRSSRKLAEYFSISQSKANSLIRKYIREPQQS
jgi:transcriptional regulator with PAS, ATPase and Fis domain